MWKTAASVLAIAVLFTTVFLVLRNERLLMDESFHYPQIVRFSKGDLTITTAVAMGPGYHVLLAPFVFLLADASVQNVRLVQLGFSLCFLLLFFHIARRLDPHYAHIKLLQIAAFPVIFPYYFIVFSDVTAMLILLLSLFLVLEKRYVWAGLVSGLSLIVRQNLIVWTVFLLYLSFIQEEGHTLRRAAIKRFLPKSLTFLLTGAGFLIFMYFNHGIVVGGGKAFLPFLPKFGNIFITFLLLFLFMIPESLTRWRGIVTYGKHHLFPVIVLGIIGYSVFLYTFDNTHPWNQTPYFLRNQLMIFFSANIFHKTLLYCIAFYEILGILTARLIKPSDRLLHIFGVGSLSFIWLVEPRYAIPYIVLFLLFRKIPFPSAGYLSILVNVCISFFIIWGLHADRFFP